MRSVYSPLYPPLYSPLYITLCSLTYPPIPLPFYIPQGKPKTGGVREWKKEPTTHDRQMEVEFDLTEGPRDGLVLDLVPNLTVASGYARGVSGPAWMGVERPARPGGYDEVEGAIKAEVG